MKKNIIVKKSSPKTNSDFLVEEYKNPINEFSNGQQCLGREKALKTLYNVKNLTGDKLNRLFSEIKNFVDFTKYQIKKNIFKQRIDILCPSYLYDYVVIWLQDENFNLEITTPANCTRRDRVPLTIKWGE